MGSKTGFNISTVRCSREHMLGVLVLPGGSRLVAAGCSWANVRVKHQVPYMARPLGHDLSHQPWRLLRYLLDIHKSSLSSKLLYLYNFGDFFFFFNFGDLKVYIIFLTLFIVDFKNCLCE